MGRGGVWILSARILQRVLSLVRTIILARLLCPNDFGLFGIALLTLATLDTFSKTGFQQALIHRKKDIRPYLDCGWTVSIVRGFALFAALYFIAPCVAAFFDAPGAVRIIQIIGFSALIQGFTNIGIVYFQRDLEFNKAFVYELAGLSADFAVAISAAVILRNAWAFVFGLLAGNLVRCFTSYFMHPYRPRLSFDRVKTGELWRYGRWIFRTNIVTFLFNQGDDAFLGKVLGVTTLGFYQMAYRIGQLPATEFAKVISRVTFPAYSKLQDNVFKLREGFLKTLGLTTFFIVPAGGFIFILAPEITLIFLTEKWMSMVPALRILIVAGMIRAFTTTGGALFQGVGRPDVDYKMNLARLAVLVMAIYPLTLFFGMNGVAAAVVLGNLACVPVWFSRTVGIVKTSVKDYFKIVFPPLLASFIVCLLIALLKSRIELNVFGFLLLLVAAAAAYSGGVYLTGKLVGFNAMHAVLYAIRSVRSR